MAKVKLEMEFDGEDRFDRQALIRTIKADDLYAALHDVAQEVFRPHRKHGYSDAKLQKLLDENESSYDVVEILEKLFYEILENYGINLDDWS